MPSKAGRRRGEAGSTVVAPPVSAVPPPSFDPALLARPLRRGYEVERFNQLARRQAELTPAESDELYAYRLRRLTARERGLQPALISGSGRAEKWQRLPAWFMSGAETTRAARSCNSRSRRNRTNARARQNARRIRSLNMKFTSAAIGKLTR